MPSSLTLSQPRELGFGEIRLLTLRPGQWSDEIRCELDYAFLAFKPYYEALSYVWGSPKITRPITLDGNICPITVNLESALRHLRWQHRVRILWVDALCINQSDTLERTKQVGIMGEIYKSARNVVVFLGDDVDRTEGRHNDLRAPSGPALHLTGGGNDMTQIKSAFVRTEINHRRERTQNTCDVFLALCFIRLLADDIHLFKVLEFFEQRLLGEMAEVLAYIFEELRKFVHSPWTPWWSRIWVLQEVVLPSTVMMVHGVQSASWEVLAAAARNYTRHAMTCCSNEMSSFPRDYTQVIADFSQQVSDIEELRIACREKASDTTEQTKLTGQEGQNRTLLSLLKRFRTRKSTDPRDKVYALLSLVQYNPSDDKMFADYELSECEVFTKAVLESIRTTQSLSVLSVDPGRKFRQDLPSWVPDWAAPREHIRRSWVEDAHIYDACAGYPINHETVQYICDSDRSSSRLRLQGRRVDRIEHTAEVMWGDTHYACRNTILHWWQTVNSMNSKVGDPRHSFWRLLCAEIISKASNSTTSRVLRRRTTPEDELSFFYWALKAQRSPFEFEKWDSNEFRKLLSLELLDWLCILRLRAQKPANDTLSIKKLLQENRLDGKYRQVLQDLLLDESLSTMRKVDRIHWYCYKSEEYDLQTSEKCDLQASEVCKLQNLIKFPYSVEQPTDAEVEELQTLEWGQDTNWADIPWSAIFSRLKRLHGREHNSCDSTLAMMDTSIMSATVGRRLFRTRSGDFGLGPAGIEKGDSVFLIKGGRSPIILRRADKHEAKEPVAIIDEYPLRENEQKGITDLHQTKEESEGMYELIGDSYITGWMDASTVEEQLRRRPSQTWKHVDLV